MAPAFTVPAPVPTTPRRFCKDILFPFPNGKPLPPGRAARRRALQASPQVALDRRSLRELRRASGLTSPAKIREWYLAKLELQPLQPVQPLVTKIALQNAAN